MNGPHPTSVLETQKEEHCATEQENAATKEKVKLTDLVLQLKMKEMH